MKKLSISLLLVLAAVSERIWFDLGPNVELVMTASVIATLLLGRKWGIGVALLSLMISDLVIGNSRIFVFTWSAFGLIAWGSSWLKNKGWQWGGVYGFCGALFFYLYTNFGVWLTGNWYPHTVAGLLKCYEMGLPFLKIHAVSSVLLLSGTLGLLNIFNLRFRVSRWKSGAVPQL